MLEGKSAQLGVCVCVCVRESLSTVCVCVCRDVCEKQTSYLRTALSRVGRVRQWSPVFPWCHASRQACLSLSLFLFHSFIFFLPPLLPYFLSRGWPAGELELGLLFECFPSNGAGCPHRSDLRGRAQPQELTQLTGSANYL